MALHVAGAGDIDEPNYINMSKRVSAQRRNINAAKQFAASRARMAKPAPRASMFGPVAKIATAPVAIGNSINGCETISRPTPQGVVAIGRDFMFSPIGSGSVTTWTDVGGTPLSPAAFSDATLRQYMQMYQKFRWKELVVHYITSSPTSANGDVMFYYGKNRDSVYLSNTSTQLLPFVMSDKNTVLGPQWSNHSAKIDVISDWKSTDYGMTSDLNTYAAGELFLLSKTSTTDSPGYVVFDYVIEFADMQITPRLLALPLPRAQYSQVNLGASGAVTAGNALVVAVTGNGISGSASALPTGYTVLDVYKVHFDITNSASGSWTVATPSTLAKLQAGSLSAVSLTLADGFTCYAVAVSTTQLQFFPNSTAAFALNDTLVYAATATITYNIQCWMSLIGTINSTNLVPNY